MQLSQRFGDRFSESMSLIFLGRTKGKKTPPQIEVAKDHISRGMRLLEELKPLLREIMPDT